jgi:hypothetical protein
VPPNPKWDWHRSATGSILEFIGWPDAASSRSFAMIHDLVLSLVFLSIIVTPALVGMRAYNDKAV